MIWTINLIAREQVVRHYHVWVFRVVSLVLLGIVVGLLIYVFYLKTTNDTIRENIQRLEKSISQSHKNNEINATKEKQNLILPAATDDYYISPILKLLFALANYQSTFTCLKQINYQQNQLSIKGHAHSMWGYIQFLELWPFKNNFKLPENSLIKSKGEGWDFNAIVYSSETKIEEAISEA